MSLASLHLAHPLLLHGLWLWLVAVGVLWLLERRADDRLERWVGRALEARLVARPARWRRRLRFVCLALAGLLMAAALVRPQWGEQFVAAPRVGAEIMIALDVSRSMLADDARPTRLDRAKAEIADLLAYLEHDQVGLIAFAGRASILSPLTPDKSFLRLALDGAGPHSVSRGGTRLAEPIQRAVAGLGEPGPAQRALILITDGDDHDSFAVDAAKRAAEAGIKIITIGFGDEAGSQIHVRNPDDGSRTLVRDGDGNPVVSRLNGELLREIALATDGAYVPAGTGVLDLASIYETHIARLTRGQLDARGRTIRGELYPLLAGAALLLLVVAVASTAGGAPRAEGLLPTGRADRLSERKSSNPRSRSTTAAVGAVSMLVVGLVFAATARGDEPDPGTAPSAQLPSPAAASGSAPPQASAAAPAQTPPSTPPPAEPIEEDPRSRFNRANERLGAGDAEAASALYREARRDATDDPELRYAASYNLGMAAVARADGLEAKSPKEALAALHEAADWFREASGMQPDEEDPRHNLDVVLRRALILADELARQSEGGLEQALDRVIEGQRARNAAAAILLEAVVREGELAAAESLRQPFDEAATAQRELSADAEALGDRVADEQAILAAKPEAERPPEERLRAASLDGVIAYLDQGIERMGQTRRQLRLRSAERAYRRGAEALDLLKRARDQLRDPVDQLGHLIGEVSAVSRATATLAGATDGAGPGEAGASPSPMGRLPAFLTPESIERETLAVEARTRELAERLSAAATNAATGSASPSGASGNSRDSALGEALTAAAPLVTRAADELRKAGGHVASKAHAEALAADGRSLEALAEARELFFDLRQLLAATHETQAAIAGIAAADARALAGSGRAGVDPTAADVAALRARSLPELARGQQRNRGRATRLEELLAAEEAALQAALSTPTAEAAEDANTPPAAPDPEAVAQLEALFEKARALLADAEGAMAEASDALAAGERGRVPDWPRVAEPAARAEAALDALRRLFLSLVERLERLARDQADLADRTGEAVALAAADRPEGTRSDETRARVTALAPEQAGLEREAGTIADALLEQSQAAAAAPPPPDSAGASGGASGPDADRLRRAADHVATAQLSMQEASETFASETTALAQASQAQAVAQSELRKALELLAPPPPPEEPKPQDDGGESPEDSEQESDRSESGEDESGESDQDDASEGESEVSEPAGESPPESDPSGADESGAESEAQLGPESGGLDPTQLLQGVRDREAERRQDNERRARERRRSAPVERDW